MLMVIIMNAYPCVCSHAPPPATFQPSDKLLQDFSIISKDVTQTM